MAFLSFRPSLLTSTVQSLFLFHPSPPLAKGRVVRTMSSASSQYMFQLRVNPLTGKSEWVIVSDEADCKNVEVPLSSTSYLDMLNDLRRNRAYRDAIDKTITGPCHVLDIGAGTGLLSMMAARAMSSGNSLQPDGLHGLVSACESYLPMGKLLRRVLRMNNMDKKIQVHHKRSDELKIGQDLPSRAHLLVSEILDSELLGEGLLPTLQHAHDMLLVENPQVIPFRATTYGQVLPTSPFQPRSVRT